MAASLVDIRGVGPALARLLTEAGLADVSSVATAERRKLIEINGIGERTAGAIQAEAIRLTAEMDPVPTGEPGGGISSRKKKAKKLRKQAKQLRAQAKLLTKKAEKSKSKKKRKRRRRQVAQLEAAAKRKRRKANKLLTG
jgi:hypothetical protein